MCGIFGRVFAEPLSGQALDKQRRLATRAADSLRHRGPDDFGLWANSRCVLSHRRLKVLDLTDRAAQPMTTSDGSVVLVFNGEIYNHRALRRTLESSGYQFRSTGDTEVVLAAYRQWGDDCIRHLDGMFALALWDNSRHRLFMARDRVGKKPLFYHVAPDGTLTFGSEIKALSVAGVPLKVQLRGLASFMNRGFVPFPETIYEGICELRPACHVAIQHGQVTEQQPYWRPTFRSGPAHSFPSVVRDVRRLVTQAVQRRLVSDVPVGLFLSGGIDSTVIAALAVKLAGPIETFTLGFEQNPDFDERRMARITANRLGTRHHEMVLGPNALNRIPALIRLHDMPFVDSSALATHGVAELASDHATVLLGGDGGDEIFGGYQRMWAAARSETIPQSLRAILSQALSFLPVGTPRSLRSRLRRFGDALPLPLLDRLQAWQNPARLRSDQFLRSRILQDTQPDHARLDPDFLETSDDALDQVMAFNFSTYLPHDLLVKADRCTMAWGLELRSPLLDTAVISHLARVPGTYKFCCGVTKPLLRLAFADLIPPSLLLLPKRGFGLPLADWFRSSMRPFVTERLFPSQARIYQILRPEAVSDLLAKHQRGSVNAEHAIFTLLTMEQWLWDLPVEMPT